MRPLRLVLALLAPWVALELVLAAVGWRPPDLRPRVAIFPRFPPFYLPDRDLGWRLRPSIRWTGPELATAFRTDEHGHRLNLLPAARRLPSSVDCIGDSTTFGYGSRDAFTYPFALQRLLNEGRRRGPPLIVRNLGVPGYTALEARILAERRGHHAPVSLVLVGFNDHFGSVRPRVVGLWRRRAAYACFRSLACSLLFDWATRRGPAAAPPERVAPERYVPELSPGRYAQELGRTVRSLRRNGSEPILLVYPSLRVDEATVRGIARHFRHSVEQVRANVAAHRRYQDLTRRVAREESVRLVDLAPVFDAAGNDRLHFDWVHPNTEGLALIAETVLGPVRDALARRPARGAGAALRSRRAGLRRDSAPGGASAPVGTGRPGASARLDAAPGHPANTAPQAR